MLSKEVELNKKLLHSANEKIKLLSTRLEKNTNDEMTPRKNESLVRAKSGSTTKKQIDTPEQKKVEINVQAKKVKRQNFWKSKW